MKRGLAWKVLGRGALQQRKGRPLCVWVTWRVDGLTRAGPPQSVGPAPPHLTHTFPSSACALPSTWIAALNSPPLIFPLSSNQK